MGIELLQSEEDLGRILEEDVALIFKHSTRCSVSAAAYAQVEAFSAAHGEVPIYVLNVLDARRLSGMVAERFGIAHQSPQIILLRDGVPVWNASHFKITSVALSEKVFAADM